jgi:hypothetical protein
MERDIGAALLEVSPYGTEELGAIGRTIRTPDGYVETAFG